MNIGANDKFFFLLSYHGKAAVMQFAFTLTEDIEATLLSKAAATAIKAFPLFGLRPVIDSDGKLVMEEANEEIPIALDDGKTVCLGSDDTGGYLFRITYKDRCIKVVASHAIGDGRSIMSFSLTLLYYYLLNTGKEIDSQGMLYTAENSTDTTLTENLFDRISSVEASEAMASQEPAENLFYAPEEKIYLGTPDSKRLVLSWDQKRFMEIVKEEKTTPLIFIHDLMARTMYEYYSLEDKTITAFVPVDLRGMLSSNSQANFTFNVDLPIDDKLLDMPSTERYARLKEMLNEAIKIQNIAAAVEAVRPVYKTLDTMSFSGDVGLDNLFDITKSTRSYLLSNIGLIKMPEDMKKYVVDAEIFFTTVEAAPVYTMLTFENRGMLVIGQNFSETGLLEALSNKLTHYGIENNLKDYGLIRLDELDINRFKHE